MTLPRGWRDTAVYFRRAVSPGPMTASRQTSNGLPLPGLRVFTPDGRTLLFRQSFYIGRDRDCEVRVEDVHVSRRHVAVLFADGQWSFRDLQSSNGVFVDRQRVEEAVINPEVTMSLGEDGPSLRIELEDASSRLEASPKDKPTGETMMLAGRVFRRDGERGGGRPCVR